MIRSRNFCLRAAPEQEELPEFFRCIRNFLRGAGTACYRDKQRVRQVTGTFATKTVRAPTPGSSTGREPYGARMSSRAIKGYEVGRGSYLRDLRSKV